MTKILVLATNTAYSVRDFVQMSFEHVGLDWEKYVEHDDRYERNGQRHGFRDFQPDAFRTSTDALNPQDHLWPGRKLKSGQRCFHSSINAFFQRQEFEVHSHKIRVHQRVESAQQFLFRSIGCLVVT